VRSTRQSSHCQSAQIRDEIDVSTCGTAPSALQQTGHGTDRHVASVGAKDFPAMIVYPVGRSRVCCGLLCFANQPEVFQMGKHHRMLPVFPTAVATLAFGVAAPPAGAAGNDENEVVIPFGEDTSLFFELNDTDGDLGIHAFIDGDAWKTLEIEGPNEREMLEIQVIGRLRRQGLTELFFESAEPSFDELSPKQFFLRFPEG
jgi:hypothetical protein